MTVISVTQTLAKPSRRTLKFSTYIFYFTAVISIFFFFEGQRKNKTFYQTYSNAVVRVSASDRHPHDENKLFTLS